MIKLFGHPSPFQKKCNIIELGVSLNGLHRKDVMHVQKNTLTLVVMKFYGEGMRSINWLYGIKWNLIKKFLLKWKKKRGYNRIAVKMEAVF